MSNITIKEEYTLPSKGVIYGDKNFDPIITIRSMTVAEEMRRLTATDMPYKNMCDIIDDCIITETPISAYDMCMGDYIFLLHKLRTVTYGPEYKLQFTCPLCREKFEYTVNLDNLPISYYDSNNWVSSITLPVSKAVVDLKFQTPRDLDRLNQERKTLSKEYPDMGYDPSYLLQLKSVIKSIDGRSPDDPVTVESLLKPLGMLDANAIIQAADKLIGKVGVDTTIHTECPSCGWEIDTMFQYTNEFFRPEICY